MAGGMRGKWGGPTMAERVAGSSADLEGCPARHCWVVDSLDGAKRAALLLEWRRAAQSTGWEGRVVYLAKLRAGEDWTLVQEWVPAVCLLRD